MLHLLPACWLNNINQEASMKAIAIFLLSSFSPRVTLPRQEAQQLVDSFILPASEFGRRHSLVDSNANNVVPPNFLIKASDSSSLNKSYGEFPLSSLDVLLNAATEYYYSSLPANEKNNNKPFNVLDVGSGCGRLCIYMALTRPDWNICGIEVVEAMHNAAVNAANHAVRDGYFVTEHCRPEHASFVKVNIDNVDSTFSSSLSLTHGDIFEHPHLVQNADVIFCYSTAFDNSNHYDPNIAAMLLSNQWSEYFAKYCQQEKTKPLSPKIVITTDKALDPQYGWRIISQINVPNREVFGSTGFIHILQT